MLTKKQKAFTIVELLIVIVVIAILAAIVVVAYNGIQQRAKLAQQTADLDKVGRAVQLWVAENGTSLGSSGHGAFGQGYGHFRGSAPGSNGYVGTSLKQMLEDAGFYQSSITSFDEGHILLAPCTTYADTKWVVSTIVTPAPAESTADQLAKYGCNSWVVINHTDPSGPYRRNLLKAY